MRVIQYSSYGIYLLQEDGSEIPYKPKTLQENGAILAETVKEFSKDFGTRVDQIVGFSLGAINLASAAFKNLYKAAHHTERLAKQFCQRLICRDYTDILRELLSCHPCRHC